MGMFSDVNDSSDLEKAQDTVGGFQPIDPGVYLATIKMMYGLESQNGAKGVFLELETEDGKTHRETVYVTNRKGENFYVRDGKKFPLPGFSTIKDLCMLTTEKSLAEQNFEDKVVKVYDPEAKAEVPKNMPVNTGMIGKKVKVGIQQSLENKQVKQGNEYVPTEEERTVSSINKFFHHDRDLTLNEALDRKTEAEFIHKWKDRYEGQVQDKRTFKGANTPNSGRPPKNAANSSNGGGSTQSLFG